MNPASPESHWNTRTVLSAQPPPEYSMSGLWVASSNSPLPIVSTS